MDIMLVGYIAFTLAVLGTVAGLVIGIHHAVDERQERAYRRRTGR